MTALEGLPAGLWTRAATEGDIEAVTELVAACERNDLGEAEVVPEDVAAEWRRPGFDLAADSLAVLDGERIVAGAEVWRREVHAYVHPDHRGRGVGSALLGWTETRARAAEPGAEIRIGQTVPDVEPTAPALLTAHGYTPRHTAWLLRLPEEAAILQQPLPPGIDVRPFDPATEEQAVYRVIEDAFSEWPDRERQTPGFWPTQMLERSDYDPGLLFVAVDGTQVVGAAFCTLYPDEGWVHFLGVARNHRGRGLGTALLQASFETFRRLGSPLIGLGTDSRAGALDLYLHVGMTVRSSYTHYAREL